MNLAECDQMIEACAKAGVVLAVRREPASPRKYVRQSNLRTRGALGEVVTSGNWNATSGRTSDWFWDIERSGGGVLMDMGCHSIAYCRWVSGDTPIESVYAEAGNFVHKRADEGRRPRCRHAAVRADGTPSERRSRDRGELRARIGGLDDRAEIYGSKGLTVADIARGSALNTFSAEGYGYAAEKSPLTRGWTRTGYEEAWNYGFPQEMAHWVDCIERQATDADRRGRARRAGDHLRGV